MRDFLPNVIIIALLAQLCSHVTGLSVLDHIIMVYIYGSRKQAEY